MNISLSNLKCKSNEQQSEITELRQQDKEFDDALESSKEDTQKLKEANISNNYMQSLLQDTPDIELYDETANKYTNETVMCVMNLTDMKVPSERVGGVIKESCKLVWKQH